MKRLYFSIIILFTAIFVLNAQKHYKMAVPNPEIPGDSIVYDIVEPSAVDYKTHFIADFMKSIPNVYKAAEVRIRPRGLLKAAFILDENGFVKDTQIIEKSGSSYEYNLVNIFNSAKPIAPGYINGKPAVFYGLFEIKDGDYKTIRVYWTPLIGAIPE